MVYANNPQAYYNGFISACRNVFLTSSVGIALFGYSNSFKISSSINMVRLGSTCIFFFSILYGINSIIGMNRYINNLKNSKTELPNYVQLDVWRNFMYLVGIYIIFLVILSVIALRRFSNYIN